MTPGDDDTIMVGNAYGGPVMRALALLAGRKQPRDAASVYVSLLTRITPDTGEVGFTPAELANDAMVALRDLAPIVLKLAELRIILRDPRRADDAWCINPHLAWAGDLKARARFASLVPPPDVEPRADP